MRKRNYKSDFVAVLYLRDCTDKEKRIPWPDCDFEARFWTATKVSVFTASRKNGVCTRCVPTGDGGMRFIFNNQRMGKGTLKWEPHFMLPDDTYPDGIEDLFSEETLGIELVDGPGDCPTEAEIDLMVPYAVIDAYDMAARSGFAGTREQYMAGLNALPDLAAMATDVTAGKAAVADALTRAGAPTAPDAPLSEMASAVGSLPVAKKMPDTLIPDLPVLVAANTRADYPYVAALTTDADSLTLDGADAYMASGLDLTTDQGGEHVFPSDGRLHYALFFFKSEDYAVPYNSVDSKVRAVYCHGGHPAYGITNSQGLFIEAYEDEGANPSPEAQKISGGSWTAIASSMTAYKGGTLASSCANLTTLSLPELREIQNGTLASSCANLTTLSLPELREMSNSALANGCSKLKYLSLPVLQNISSSMLVSGSPEIQELNLPRLESVYLSEGHTGLIILTKPAVVRLPMLKRFEAKIPGWAFFYNCDNFTTEVEMPECEYFHCKLSDLSSAIRPRFVFGPNISHIYTIGAYMWNTLTITIPSGAVTDIMIGTLINLSIANIREWIVALGDNTGNPVKRIELGANSATLIGQLSDEEKAILTAKNYSLS